MIRQLEKLFDQQIRPALASHGGNVEIVDVDNNKLFVRFVGGCQGCAASKATLQGGVEETVKKHFDVIEEVIDLTDHKAGENPYYK